MRLCPSPFIFSPEMPINTGGLRVNGFSRFALQIFDYLPDYTIGKLIPLIF